MAATGFPRPWTSLNFRSYKKGPGTEGKENVRGEVVMYVVEGGCTHCHAPTVR